MNQLTTGRTIGALFLAAFLLYGLGSALTEADSAAVAALGAALVVGNSVAVAAIGVLALRVFAEDRAGARIYLLTRLTEALVLAAGLWSTVDADRSFWIAMLVLGVGSVPLCLILERRRLVSRPIAILGLIGYPVLALGALLELSGWAVGYWFFIPGGLFEVLVGIVLLSRGFRAAPSQAPRAHPLRPKPARARASQGRTRLDS